MRTTLAAIVLSAILVSGTIGCRKGSASEVPSDPTSAAVPAGVKYEIDAVAWINSPPLKLANLHGKVVLVDFWEYTCINCIRTFPYVKEWWKRYHDRGLVIIGVHTPEFAFAREVANVRQAVKRFGITYPVAVDSDIKTWTNFGNNTWPHHFFFDAKGKLRHDHEGEGDYQESERTIQKLLAEAGNPGPWPEPLAPVRDMDVPGAECYPTTPETYLGYERGAPGNAGRAKHDKASRYVLPADLKADAWYLEGTWLPADEYVSPKVLGAKLTLRYSAAQVYIVMHVAPSGPEKVYVAEADDGPLKTDGTDLKTDEQGRAYLLVDENRMYTVVDHGTFGSHELILSPAGAGVEMYSFTFGTSCK